MASIQTVEQAANRADAFLVRYHSYERLLSASKERDSWKLAYDVGVFVIERVEVTLEAATVDVTGYVQVGR